MLTKKRFLIFSSLALGLTVHALYKGMVSGLNPIIFYLGVGLLVLLLAVNVIAIARERERMLAILIFAILGVALPAGLIAWTIAGFGHRL